MNKNNEPQAFPEGEISLSCENCSLKITHKQPSQCGYNGHFKMFTTYNGIGYERILNNHNSPETQAWEEEFKKENIWMVFDNRQDEPVAYQTDVVTFIRTLRQKDKERLMAGISRLWRSEMNITESVEYMNGYMQSLKDVLNFLTENYE